LLNDKCIEIDNGFEKVRMECGFLNRYINEIRYPYRIQVYEEDVVYVINSVEKIRNIDALNDIREELRKKDNENNKNRPNCT
jgi:hypothetical protein